MFDGITWDSVAYIELILPPQFYLTWSVFLRETV